MAILPVFFAENLEFFCSNSEIHLKNTSLFERTFLLSKDPQRSKTAISKNLPKNLCKNQNLTKRVLEHQELWWNLTPGYVIFSLEKAAKSFLGNFLEFFAQSLKQTKDCFFFTKLFLFQNVSFLPIFLPKI